MIDNVGNLEKKPYRSYTLDEDREEATSETINIRLNALDRDRLDRLKWLLQESKDGTALKYALEMALNVAQNTLSEKSWLKICSERRNRDKVSKPKSLEN